MSSYTADIRWNRGEQDFLDNCYSRKHLWSFDGGIRVPASSSPHVVPLPYSDEDAVDPEEAFVASLSSCHMLWFLSIAAKKGFVVDEYRDQATGVLEKNAAGKLAMTQVILHPLVQFSGSRIPSRADIEALHHKAHEECFIANSVLTQVTCEPQYEDVDR